MKREMFKSKIHRATVTDADLHYEGSITIDKDLMDLANIKTYEKVDIYNITNGARFSTYTIDGKRGGGEICLNGAAARMVQPGDMVIIVSYGLYDEEELENHNPIVIQVDEKNRPINKDRVLA
ncbi:aspartate 1-decarboxylase [Deferribacterales bacterium Es71-Z0220]|jgi:aspartate 1-decarboxylase|uniref:aspartate 1-decarboxylase n=1 Tax=Deferrivibrio essentukiensis TaxID=2880922 RepID=UPI001F606B37|nr:aspartate 1-decarboxylase [Deferrivibrio essentukiensis]MBZ4671997.1 panD [Deferribacteraceae bacterium]MCB4204134.1 aspartate 1-decarboxylase [Deferrivibrio essentukiensis]